MSEFEEYWNEGFNSYDDAKGAAKDTWQHQQAEIDAITKQRDSFIKAHHIVMNDVCENKAKIDELQARVDNVLKTIEWHLEDCACFHPMSNYQLGWFEAMSLIKEELIKCNEKQHSEY